MKAGYKDVTFILDKSGSGIDTLICNDIAYSAGYNLIAPSTVTRYNQGVHIRALVTAFGKQVVLVSTVATYTFDVAPFLRAGLIEQAKPAPALNSIINSGGNMAYTYSVQLQEWGLNAAGVPEAFISAGVRLITRAYRLTWHIRLLII